MEPMIKIENLTKKFKNNVIFENLTAEVNKGDVISLLGPSGAGKSTFLRCINMLGEPTSGKILLNGKDLVSSSAKELIQLRTKIGMVFQGFNLFENKSVLDNITLAPIKVKGMTKAAAENKAHKLLKTVGLDSKANVFPASLSGGQAQRVAIVRALAMDPEVILFDEPTSALDPEKVGEVLNVMKELANQDMTMIIVTHEMEFAKNVSDQIWFMDEGKLQEKQTPDDFFNHPETKQAKRFLSKMI
ncbi:amino acid ABC transporter ATP-binding protein [Apilactobacillus timberlakei]|uniref:Amino acid ABC transporter ATP-binding protein n=1 Tax=Apilactobacillus timberlakei TaxID=2008380 RepID=A0ABY2YTQ8_9LACO|nr:amino acid ABC transporter ATP-binding protein [Apilactobacillus timberlakei]TPR13274.1 amino acid ABC transporter ATP-binding protein [Apilactobacillus timberlakei]TPR14319.1 amino acid ABC transporter ATP-binding protein [Apilactobacillus timberlakei]TPR16572.1 amino acid ABC transporter ATP-binding protein [Apilactobacillus timberlakei]TPR19623.1 amino acid ABC transporter ATP-binding protein [Apilactobacillus timberlakei]TPR20600.1 amino acid ABC transporter ATP-binding protein [Apilact